MKNQLLIVIFLIFGVIFRLLITANGNFLFNMDNARDMVDVREMVMLKKPRLTGPNSAVLGLFNGPAWYYLLAIPFIISGGDPYASILMEIFLWLIGGIFLLKTMQRFGFWALIISGFLWATSNYIVLTNLYAFNPNPVTLLTPLFIFLVERFINTGKIKYSILMWLLAGFFFNCEMNIGVFLPLIIISALLLLDTNFKTKIKTTLIGSSFFILALAPQVLFDLKHQFIMSKGVIHFILDSQTGAKVSFLDKTVKLYQSFRNAFSGTLLNQERLTLFAILIIVIFGLNYFLKKRTGNNIIAGICLLTIFIPFVGFMILPVTVNPWHLGMVMVAGITLLAIILQRLLSGNLISKLISVVVGFSIVWFSINNVLNFFLQQKQTPSQDSSVYENEIAAIDYVYRSANGENFKVYVYMPSVIDYPYQYLIWWYGKKKYGYVPYDYAYSPNKPPYISSKSAFSGKQTDYHGLVFLIEEPDNNYTESGWSADYRFMQKIAEVKIGPLQVKTKREMVKP